VDSALREPATFRTIFLALPPDERERWFDELLSLEELPLDEESLPRGCVPYLPCSLGVLVQTIEFASITAADTFVDIGSGLGRALCFVHLFTGARAIGFEIQPGLVARARELSARLGSDAVQTFQGDASELIERDFGGSLFFLYCPFQGERVEKVIRELARKSAAERLRLCTVDMPRLDHPAFELEVQRGGLAVYRTNSREPGTLHSTQSE